MCRKHHSMKLTTFFSIWFCLVTLPLAAFAQTNDSVLLSRAESSHYEETSRYDDVLRFFNELQLRSPLMRQEFFGRTQEGRAMPLVILSDPPISDPREARASGKPVIFIMANIHAGEVEGKEAMQHLARRILTGDLHPLLDKLIVLIAPDYNADGNESISTTNRVMQYGPIGGVGRRENAQGYDLNRDYMKMEAPETRALIALFNTWDPLLTVDLHTTDGSYHGYHLTYSIPLNPTINSGILSWSRDKMMPALTRAMSRDGFRTYYYGNFVGVAPAPGQPETRSWYAFSQQPRVGQNYVGFRNRLTILSEAYSYLDFEDRIAVTSAFVEEILKFSAANAKEIREITTHADQETINRARASTPPQIGVEYKPTVLAKKIPVLVGQVTNAVNPRSGIKMTVAIKDLFTAVPMWDYGLFTATRSVPEARAYLFRAEDGLHVVTEKLLAHGIAVETLTAPLTIAVENFAITNVTTNPRAFQAHHEVKLAGQFKTETVTFPEGSLLVRTAQPLGTLAAYLLEPETDDGLVTWNFLDAYVGPGKVYPISKLTTDANISARILQP
jgi:Zinc carboxypeptidase